MTRLEQRIRKWFIRRWNLAEAKKVGDDQTNIVESLHELESKVNLALRVAINAYPPEKQNELKRRFSHELQKD